MDLEVEAWSSRWRRLALQTAMEGRYLDAVIYGYVESSLDVLLWVIHCVSIARQEEAAEQVQATLHRAQLCLVSLRQEGVMGSYPPCASHPGAGLQVTESMLSATHPDERCSVCGTLISWCSCPECAEARKRHMAEAVERFHNWPGRS